jgi:hypothetical protein
MLLWTLATLRLRLRAAALAAWIAARSAAHALALRLPWRGAQPADEPAVSARATSFLRAVMASLRAQAAVASASGGDQPTAIEVKRST